MGQFENSDFYAPKKDISNSECFLKSSIFII